MNRRALMTAFAIIVVSIPLLLAGEIPTAKPESVGMSSCSASFKDCSAPARACISCNCADGGNLQPSVEDEKKLYASISV